MAQEALLWIDNHSAGHMLPLSGRVSRSYKPSRVPPANHSLAEQGQRDAQAGKVSMCCRRDQDGATRLQNRGPCTTLSCTWDRGWVIISTHHAQSSAASLETQYRAYSLDGSVDPGKQESPSWVGG